MLPYIGKLLIFQSKTAFKMNASRQYALYISTPSFHNKEYRSPLRNLVFKSFTSGAKYTLISFPGYLEPEINKLNIINFLFIHNCGGRL